MHRRRTRHTPTLLIDAMGTLVTLRDPVPPLRAQLSARLGLDVEPAAARQALGAEVAYYREHMQDGADVDSLRDLRQRCARVLAQRLGPVAASAPPGQMTEILLATLRFVALPDAAPALRRVRGTGAQIVVVSNWDVSLVDVLEETGLAPLLDAVVTSAAVGARKPDAAIFETALALARARPGDALHVGDSAAEDVAGARACGIDAVLLDRSAPVAPVAPASVTVIASLDALPWPPRAASDHP